jgi:hypothetical protein
MITSCPDTELEHISTNFINFPIDVGYIHSPAVKEQRIMLSIANLKRYLLTDGHKLVKVIPLSLGYTLVILFGSILIMI